MVTSVRVVIRSKRIHHLRVRDIFEETPHSDRIGRKQFVVAFCGEMRKERGREVAFERRGHAGAVFAGELGEALRGVSWEDKSAEV